MEKRLTYGQDYLPYMNLAIILTSPELRKEVIIILTIETQFITLLLGQKKVSTINGIFSLSFFLLLSFYLLPLLIFSQKGVA